jgi:hypothetical protein
MSIAVLRRKRLPEFGQFPVPRGIRAARRNAQLSAVLSHT